MGYMKHHAIVVTCWNPKGLEMAHTEAIRIFDYVSPMSAKAMNGFTSFFIPPDGSKEGWEESDTGDTQRDRFMSWCDEQAYDDGSNSLACIEVWFAAADEPARVVRVTGTDSIETDRLRARVAELEGEIERLKALLRPSQSEQECELCGDTVFWDGEPNPRCLPYCHNSEAEERARLKLP